RDGVVPQAVRPRAGSAGGGTPGGPPVPAAGALGDAVAEPVRVGAAGAARVRRLVLPPHRAGPVAAGRGALRPPRAGHGAVVPAGRPPGVHLRRGGFARLGGRGDGLRGGAGGAPVARRGRGLPPALGASVPGRRRGGSAGERRGGALGRGLAAGAGGDPVHSRPGGGGRRLGRPAARRPRRRPYPVPAATGRRRWSRRAGAAGPRPRRTSSITGVTHVRSGQVARALPRPVKRWVRGGARWAARVRHTRAWPLARPAYHLLRRVVDVDRLLGRPRPDAAQVRVRMDVMRRRLLNLGFTDRALADLAAAASDDANPLLRRLAAGEIALWYADRYRPEDAERALAYLDVTAGGAADRTQN